MSELEPVDTESPSHSPVHSRPRSTPSTLNSDPQENTAFDQVSTDHQLVPGEPDYSHGNDEYGTPSGFDQQGTPQQSSCNRRQKVLIIDDELRAKILPRYGDKKRGKKARSTAGSEGANNEQIPINDVTTNAIQWQTGHELIPLLPYDKDDSSKLSHYANAYSNRTGSNRRDNVDSEDKWAVHPGDTTASSLSALSLSPNRKSSSPSRILKKSKTADGRATASSRFARPKTSEQQQQQESQPKSNIDATAEGRNGCVFIVDIEKFDKEQAANRETDIKETCSKQMTTNVQTEMRSRWVQCASCCRSFAAFLFSTIGLTCLLVGYVMLGGIVFVQLESDNEQQTASDMENVKRDHIRLLWTLTEQLNVLHPENWTSDADEILENYTAFVFTYIKKKGWDGNFNEEAEQQWSFAGALLYSITIITTIGMYVFNDLP